MFIKCFWIDIVIMLFAVSAQNAGVVIAGLILCVAADLIVVVSGKNARTDAAPTKPQKCSQPLANRSVLHCPYCGSPVQVYGKTWECGWCGDSGRLK